ncbi:polysaccharide biosynthesis C-terminal domain-containing protein [Verrucomicrobiales bacterium BCK34]|nr:polysaccharide biosynthesis C-terminal domain-containing protein [Verrucomicrobiales bacterium BCK34]
MVRETNKLASGVIWNLIAFGVSASVGLCLNFGVARFFGPEVLGSFNWVFAAYIIASQLAAFGIHLSLVKHVGEVEHRERQLEVMRSGMRAVLLPAFLFGILFYGLSFLVESVVPVEGVRRGMEVAAPSVTLFAFNKALLGCFNGMRAMRLYAVALMARALGIAVSFVLILVSGIDREYLPLVFLGGEIFAALIAIGGAFVLKTPFWSRGAGDGVKRHWNFGLRALPGGLLAELNTRVDILILGMFVTDYSLGIYSFSALLAEGLYQVAVVLRSNVNPIISREWASGSKMTLEQFICKGRFYGYAAGVPMCGVAVLLYPVVAKTIGGDAAFTEGWVPFAILAGGLALISGYIPFSQVLLQTGSAFRNSVLVGIGVLANIILNVLLIPVFGLIGAAAATAISWVLSVIMLRVWVRRLNGIRF